MDETPLRRRGGRRPGLSRGPADRSNPASVGRTPSRSSPPDPRTEHPRFGGEDVPTCVLVPPTRGRPPRRRGGQRRRVRGGDLDRNTPASAGRTCGARNAATTGAEHPRVGGEDEQSCTPEAALDGTPPRRWGERRAGRRGRQQDRSTPASAGRTYGAGTRSPRRSEHPRVGGDELGIEPSSPPASGTPPRRRGGRGQGGRDPCSQRNTPASAGRTGSTARASPGSTEHPRVGGEDLVMKNLGTPVVGTPHVGGENEPLPGERSPGPGTPPRQRGGPPRLRQRDARGRNTPASAGRTSSTPRSPCRAAEHLRVGGEEVRRPAGGAADGGTPPRRRGGLDDGHLAAGTLRNTPAYAGRTSAPPPGPGTESEHPPRRRGGLLAHRLLPLADRNTPASAGRTSTRTHATATWSEHPRVGGGGPCPAPTRQQGPRNTPALAGRTSR